VRRSLERVALGDSEKKRCEELSKGTLQKVQILAAIIHEPDLLILDEPFTGLDPVSTRLLRDIVVAEHRRGATILFSTHAMHQAEDLCEHVVMIHRGRKVLDEQMGAIRRRFDPRTIRFEPMDPEADLAPLRALKGVERVEKGPGGCDVVLAAGTDPSMAIQQIAAAVAPSRIELARLRLEDVFVSLVSSPELADRRVDEARPSEVVS
jgi:ABC-2 type transport system ATP-binding protein